MKTDLNYTTDGFFIMLVPNTKDGEYIWNEVAKAFDGVAKFPVHMKAGIFKQIKDAGYSIRKKRKSNKNLDQILSELDDLELLKGLGV